LPRFSIRATPGRGKARWCGSLCPNITWRRVPAETRRTARKEMELEQSAVQELFTSDAIFVYSIKERHAPVSFSTALPATAWLAAIVESSSDAIISKTLDGIITSWNGAAESLFGYRADEVIGCHISILAAPGKEQEMASIIERIRRNERVQPYETKRRRKDGSLIHVSLTVSRSEEHTSAFQSRENLV